MLTIRPEQLEIFAELEERKFEKWMLTHLLTFFPDKCGTTGNVELQGTIRHGIKRAAAYGVTSKAGVCKYIDLMVVFGSNFDADPRFPWAGQILGAATDSATKMRSALRAAQARLRKG